MSVNKAFFEPDSPEPKVKGICMHACRVSYNLASRILATRNPINACGVSSFLNL